MMRFIATYHQDRLEDMAIEARFLSRKRRECREYLFGARLARRRRDPRGLLFEHGHDGVAADVLEGSLCLPHL